MGSALVKKIFSYREVRHIEYLAQPLHLFFIAVHHLIIRTERLPPKIANKDPFKRAWSILKQPYLKYTVFLPYMLSFNKSLLMKYIGPAFHDDVQLCQVPGRKRFVAFQPLSTEAPGITQMHNPNPHRCIAFSCRRTCEWRPIQKPSLWPIKLACWNADEESGY